MPFLNTGRFIEEAIQSVVDQTHSNWELLLIDDGSTDASTQIALSHHHKEAERFRYLAHKTHESRGASAARNLGLHHVRGDYVALLDSDDVWVPNQLERQVEILKSTPQAGIVYGNTEYWYSWAGSGGGAGRDFFPKLGVPSHTLFAPPRLLALYLSNKATVPCTCSILIRSGVIKDIGGFEEEFRHIYTDQVFYAKLFACTPAFVVDEPWGKYRRHENSCVAVAEKKGTVDAVHLSYLEWLEGYLREQHIQDKEVWMALSEELWNLNYAQVRRSHRRWSSGGSGSRVNSVT